MDSNPISRRGFLKGAAGIAAGVALGLGRGGLESALARRQQLTFTDNFERPRIIEEAWPMSDSEDPFWWVNSGAYLEVRDGIGMTVQGELPGNYPSGQRWLREYRSSNPTDTGDGRLPQNIFRAFQRQNITGPTTEQCYFLVNRHNPTQTEERGAWSGIYLYIRADGEGGNHNFYSAGLRADGRPMIETKKGGEYIDDLKIRGEKLFPGAYDRDGNPPSLIPLDTWIGLKTEVMDRPSGVVEVRLYTDIGRTGNWREVVSLTDDSGDGLTSGHGALRTDYADVSFDDYSIASIS